MRIFYISLLVLLFLPANANDSFASRAYQHYFLYCLKNAAQSKMNAKTGTEICDCVASTIVENMTELNELSEDELQDIAAMCLGKHFLKR